MPLPEVSRVCVLLLIVVNMSCVRGGLSLGTCHPWAFTSSILYSLMFMFYSLLYSSFFTAVQL